MDFPIRGSMWFFASILIVAIHLFAACAASGQQDGPKRGDDKINEQTIYIPYDKLREVFERDGRGVFLPYDKFQQLWNEARKNQPVAPDLSPPVGALITDIESVATLGNEIVSVDAIVKIELLRKGWQRVALRLGDAAIRRATIGDREARIVAVADGGYELLVEHDQDQPASIALQLSYAKSLDKTRGQSNVSFQSPQAPVNRWTIRTGQKDMEIAIEPMIASTKKSAAETAGAPNPGDEILAFVGAAPEVRIRWTPKSEGATGLAALISAETNIQVHVDDGVMRTSAIVNSDISRTELTSLQLKVPADHKVVNVFDRNVKRWDVKADDATQTINIELFEPAIGRQVLAVELERFTDQKDVVAVSVPQIEMVGASRNQGMIFVKLATGLRGELDKRSGLQQLDRSELPAELANHDWRLAFRYASLPFDLTVNVDKVQPLITVRQLVEVVLEPEKLTAEMSLAYDIQQAGVFQLLLEVPEGFELQSVRPMAKEGRTGAAVDSFYRDTTSATRWIVTLSNKAMGNVGLAVTLKRDLNDPNLLSPTGETSDISIVVPRVAGDGIEYASGNIVVYAPESLQINSKDVQGLRSESFQNALAGQDSMIAQNTSVRSTLAFGFSEGPASLTVQAKRRRPQVTVNQLLVATVKTGVVEYSARFFYNIRYSGVKELRLDVPTSLVGQLRNRSSNIVQQSYEPVPTDIAEGYSAWKLTGENEFFGQHEIHFTWEEKLDELALGKSLDIAVPRLVPIGSDTSVGQIVTTKSETIDVQPKSEAVGLRPIDPKTDLYSEMKIENAAMAFEFVDEWSLQLTATRYELEDLKRTSIPRALIRAVALRQNQLSVQALYQIRSVQQRIAIQMPTGFDPATSFDDQPITVNGRRIAPERGGNDLIYVPLTEQDSSQAFLLELRYTIPGSQQQIELPTFPDDPAVQKVYLCVYVPHETALLSKSGNWSDQALDNRATGPANSNDAGFSASILENMFNLRNENVNAYLDWVYEGVPVDKASARKFETDGRPYIFSTLRPEPAPDGTLRLRSVNRTLLHVIVCIVIGLIGIVFLRRGLTAQLAALIISCAALVACGVFLPLVTEHLIGEVLLLSGGLVVSVWLILDFGRWTAAVRTDRKQRRQATATQSPQSDAAIAAPPRTPEPLVSTEPGTPAAGDGPAT